MIIDSEFLNLKRSTKLVKQMLGNLFPDGDVTLIECNDDKAIKSGVRFRALVSGIELADSAPFAYTVFNLSDGSVYHGISWAMGEGHGKEGLTFADCDYTGSPCGSDYREKRDNLTPEHFLMIIHTLVPTPKGYGGWEKKVRDAWLQDNLGQLESDLISWSRDEYRGVTSNKSNGGINGGGGCSEHSLETCDAMADAKKGKPNGRGQAIYIKESNGSEHVFGSRTEAADFLESCGQYSDLSRERIDRLVVNGSTRNKKSLKVNEATGLLICYEQHRNNPVRLTHLDRMIKGVRRDGSILELSKRDWMDKYGKTADQLSVAVGNSARHGDHFMGEFLMSWADGVVQSHKVRVIFDRSNGQQVTPQELKSRGFNYGGVYKSAKANSSKLFVSSNYKDTYFVFEEDLEKPITPPLHQHPLAVLTAGDISTLDIFNSSVEASKRYGRDKSAWKSATDGNSKLIAKGTAPNKWRKVSATYTVIHLHELPRYCQLTDQEMPISLLWYVDAIAEYNSANPHADSKQSLAKAA